MESQMTLLRVVAASVPALVLFTGSLALFRKEKAMSSVLQLFGTGCLMIVVIAHFCEVVQLLPSMGWGIKHSVGHYLDLGSAVAGLSSFPLGYLLHALNLKPQ